MAKFYGIDHKAAAQTYALLVAAVVAVGILPFKRLLSVTSSSAPRLWLHKLSLLTLPVWPYPSAVDLLLIALYIVVAGLLGATRLTVTNDEEYPRFGFLALATFSIMTLLPQRNSPLAALLGVDRQRCISWHAILGIATVFFVTLHGSLYLVEWFHFDFFWDELQSRAMITYGLSAGGVFSAVFLTSAVPLVRRFSYELFYWVHIASYPTLIALIYLHTPESIPFIFPGVVLYGLDRLLRIARFLRPSKIIDAKVEGDVLTRISIHQPSLLGSYGTARAGQYFYVQFPTISPFEWHPFSMISPEYPAHGNAGVVQSLLDDSKTELDSDSGSDIQRNGSASLEIPLTAVNQPDADSISKAPAVKIPATNGRQNLYTFAIRKRGFFTKTLQRKVESGVDSLPVLLDGPYGNSFDGVLDYKSVLLVGGGIGITPLISILLTILARNHAESHKGHPISVDLVWVVRQTASLGARIHLFSTQRDDAIETKDTGNKQIVDVHGIPVEFARPQLLDMMLRIKAERPGQDVAVA
eukprot:jgi/Hompol1/6203/HPOL_004873-RA